MTTAQREARAFLSEFHHRPFSVSDLEKALQAQGFSLVEYSRLSNGRDVTTLLTSLQLFDYAAKQSAFTYQDPQPADRFSARKLVPAGKNDPPES